MTCTEQRDAIVNIDAATVGVRLQEGSMVLVDRADFETLKAQSHVGHWFLSKGQGLAHVVSRNNRTTITPARLIADAGPGEVVRYANGSRLDLRRRNLKSGPRRGGVRQRLLAKGRYLATVVATNHAKGKPCR